MLDDVLERIYLNSQNMMTTVWEDFYNIAHINSDNQTIDFSKYGYTEFCMMSELLNLFESWGYEDITDALEQTEDMYLNEEE